jgi:hypothetical protein
LARTGTTVIFKLFLGVFSAIPLTYLIFGMWKTLLVLLRSSMVHCNFRKHAKGFQEKEMEVDMTGRRCVVTGSNQGIGFASAEALAARYSI